MTSDEGAASTSEERLVTRQSFQKRENCDSGSSQQAGAEKRPSFLEARLETFASNIDTIIGDVIRGEEGSLGIATKDEEDELSATTSKQGLQYKVGDHVFKWCSYLNIPFAYQEHGIVVALSGNNSNDKELVILNLDHHQEQEEEQKERCLSITPQRLSLQEASTEWEHVQYGETQWHVRLSLRAGTCTPDPPDPLPVVLYRIQFLQKNPHLLADLKYDSHKRNGECVAVWCQTGQFLSHAGAAKQGQAGLHVGTFSLASGIAAQLAASAVVPVLLPFMAAYDVGQALYDGKELYISKKEWNETTLKWNELFEDYWKKVVQEKTNGHITELLIPNNSNPETLKGLIEIEEGN